MPSGLHCAERGTPREKPAQVPVGGSGQSRSRRRQRSCFERECLSVAPTKLHVGVCASRQLDLSFGEVEPDRLCPSPLCQSGDVPGASRHIEHSRPACDLGGVEHCPRRLLRDATPVSMIRLGCLFPPCPLKGGERT